MLVSDDNQEKLGELGMNIEIILKLGPLEK
jgi:hypothetical protein